MWSSGRRSWRPWMRRVEPSALDYCAVAESQDFREDAFVPEDYSGQDLRNL